MSTTFEPSYGWQPVPNEAVLPPGLQIEVDVTTGRKRARLQIPEALVELAGIKHWCGWEEGTKRPLHPKTLRGYKELTRDILEVLERVKGSRVGFYAFADDPWVLIDIDNVRDPETGKIADWAMALVRLLDSYTEISPSGRGLHIIIRCRDKPKSCVVQKYGDAQIELRVDKQYITITGDVIHGSRIREHPREIFDHPLFKASAGNGEEKSRLRVVGGVECQDAKLDIIVSAERGLAARDLMLLEENHPDFWRVWTKRASPARDATHSGYMASIARRLVSMGRDGQWIADALVDFCHKHKRPDCIDQRQFERCILLARSDPSEVNEKPELLQAAVDALAEDESLEDEEDPRAAQLRILSQHFRMEIADVRRFGRNPGKVQFCNCSHWIDVGTPAQILNQTHVLAALYSHSGQGQVRVKAERWARIATIIGRNWRVEDAGDEEAVTALEDMIEVQPASSIESVMNLRSQRQHHDWEGKRYVFAPALKQSAAMNGIANLYDALRAAGYKPDTVAAAGKTSRSVWWRPI